ncbi:MAG: methyltransferase domain-containing protein [Candidatus Binatia bacterium]
MNDQRDEYISKVVNGQSFADIGGLWGTVSEKVSIAHRFGAKSLAMIDIAPEGHELWRLFEERRRELQLPEVHYVSGDIMHLVNTEACPQFDVVHCSGVLYHIPNPLQLLLALRRITRKYLILTSSVTVTRIESAQGVLEIPRAAVLFIPALQERERAILKAYWERFVGINAVGLTSETVSWRLDDFSPWWWLPTVEALKAMCETVGFHCLDGSPFWNDNAHILLLSVREELNG